MFYGRTKDLRKRLPPLWLLLAGTTAFCTLERPVTARADRQSCVSAHIDGQELRLKGAYGPARERFSACAQKSCPAILQRDCSALLAELDAARTAVTVAVYDADGASLQSARVLVDGAPVERAPDGGALALGPGRYQLRVDADGYTSHAQTLAIDPGERERTVRVQLSRVQDEAAAQGGSPTLGSRTTPSTSTRGARADELSAGPNAEEVEGVAPTPKRITPAVYILGASALAVLSTGVALGARGLSEKSRLEKTCGELGCTRAQTEQGRRLYIAADVAFATAGALTAAATWVFVANRRERRRARAESAPRLAAAIDSRGAALVVRGAF